MVSSLLVKREEGFSLILINYLFMETKLGALSYI